MKFLENGSRPQPPTSPGISHTHLKRIFTYTTYTHIANIYVHMLHIHTSQTLCTYSTYTQISNAYVRVRPTCEVCGSTPSRWLRLVCSLKLYLSFAEYCLFYRALLQKRPTILRSLLIVATPYHQVLPGLRRAQKNISHSIHQYWPYCRNHQCCDPHKDTIVTQFTNTHSARIQ